MEAADKAPLDSSHLALLTRNATFLEWSNYEHDDIIELLRSKALPTVGRTLADLSPEALRARGLIIPFFWTSLLLDQTYVAVRRVPLGLLRSADEQALYAELLATQGEWQSALSIAEQALASDETSITKSIYGITLTHFQHDQGVETLRAGICDAEAQGNAWHNLYFSTALIRILVSSGAFAEAAFRASWCSKTARALQLTEEPALERQVQVWTFAQLLTQPYDKDEVRESTSPASQPEHSVSLADQLLVQGNINEALTIYQALWHENIERSRASSLGHMLVRVLLEQGNVEDALKVAKEAHSLTLDLPTRYLTLLTRAMALSFYEPVPAIPLLEQALDLSQTFRCAFRSVQAGLYLIRALLLVDAYARAHEVADLIRPWFCELGPDGVTYLSGPASEFQATLQLLCKPEGSPLLRMKFLGAMECMQHGEALCSLRKRHAELLALLVLHPKGLTGEELAAKLYGDEGNFERCKVEIGRLKHRISIDNRPYRLLGDVEADFITVIQLLQDGELQQAVALYRGPLLPLSTAPGIIAEREYIDETIRQAALRTGNPEALWTLAQLWEDDLELWEELAKHIPEDDPRQFQVQARVKVCTEAWKVT